MSEAQTLDRNTIDELVRQTARERSLETDKVFGLIEEALARVLNRTNDRSGDFRVKIDRDNYSMKAWRLWEVIPDDQPIEDIASQKTFEAAKEIDPDAKVGGEISVECKAPDINRHTNAQIFKQKYLNCLRQAENSKLLDDLLERGDTLVNGTVKRIDRASGDYIIEVQRVECRLKRQDAIPKESLRPGDRTRCLIREIKEDPNRGRMVYLSRTSDEFLKELFRREVPEIEKDILEIVGVSRDPGYRSKIAVRSRDPRVDPVGTCVGMRGSRVQSVTADLSGEKVDIIPWDSDEMNFVLRALAPAEIESVRVIGTRSCDVIVKEDSLAKAIGKGGMNVKLASRLTGWQINITDQQEADEREMNRIERKQNYFMKQLDVDESVARILYDEGFNTVDDLAETDKEELQEIEAFDEDMVSEIIQRAEEAVESAKKEFEEKLAKSDDGLRTMVTDEMLKLLILNDVLSVEGLAELSVDDLLEFIEDVTEEEAQEIILEARKACGWLEDGDEEGVDAE